MDNRNRTHNARDRGVNSCGLSVCRGTPPSCLDQSTSNFQGMLGTLLAAHISEISMIW